VTTVLLRVRRHVDAILGVRRQPSLPIFTQASALPFCFTTLLNISVPSGRLLNV
jgi:hypothetical protein